MVRLGSDIGGIDLQPGETITVGDTVYELTEDGELRGVESLHVEETRTDSMKVGDITIEESHDGRLEVFKEG
jgi:uncharacterized Zn finger protein